MPRKKLQKIKALHTLPNVIEMADVQFKNKLTNFLAKEKNITLELGCGKGEYTLGLARLMPKEKFIGIDIQGERLWHGATIALQEKLHNVLFLRLPIENILDLFTPQSIKKIWLTFPDPQNKNSDAKKRLTSPRFLKIYQQILKTNGSLNLKTDNIQLFLYSENSIQNQGGQIIIAKKLGKISTKADLNITTTYEQIYLKQGLSIYYLQAKL